MKTVNRIVSGLVSVVLLVAVLIGLWQRQNIYDWWRLNNYDPPSQIVELAKNTKMTDYSKKLFYVNRPQLNDRADFNNNCQTQEQTIILGCYINHRGIYVFNVKDERLKGIKEVTAAHEMLHAAYDRLSNKERARVDKLTSDAYKKLANERLNKTIVLYRNKDPSVVPNELHSILGTEIRELPAELNNYYKQYFTDRLAVVIYSEKYEKTLIQQQDEIKKLESQINSAQKDLVVQKTEITNMEAELNNKSQQLQNLKNSNDISSYNSMVPDYNAMVYQVRALVKNYNDSVVNLNAMIDKYNNLAIEQKQLNSEIDSHTSTTQ